MKYCTKCGKELCDLAVVCVGCGCAVEAGPVSAAPVSVTPVSVTVSNDLLTKLSERIKMNGIIWIVIAIIQIIIGLCGTWLPLVVGVLNLVSAIKDMEYSKTVLQNPTGIVANFESLTSPIITLVYNLVIGGFIGVIGSIYYFVALRGFVMENKNAFLALEQQANVTSM